MLTPAELVRVALLRPELRIRAIPFIEHVEAATGKKVSIPPRGGLRSSQDQMDLWNDRGNNPYPVAQPGTSRHEYGAALDINIANGTAADYAMAATIAANQYGLTPGLYFTTPDQVHFQLTETLAESQTAYLAMQQNRMKLWALGGLAAVAGFLLLTTPDED